MKDSDPPTALPQKANFWIGVLGSLVTIVLTIWNTYTKSQIDRSEAELKKLEIRLDNRKADFEESKDRVERYKWVLSLFPVLTSADKEQRTFTLNLARLALSKEDAAQLFAGLQSSSDTTLRKLGNAAVTAIESEPIAKLVAQMNAQTASVRKQAVATLVQKYSSAPQAITLTLRTLDERNIDNLSSSAIINSLYFLSATEPSSWNSIQYLAAQKSRSYLERKGVGAQTRAALNTFNEKLKKIYAVVK